MNAATGFTGFFRLFNPHRSIIAQNYTLPSVLQCPGKSNNPASSAEMQQSHCRWQNTKPQFCNKLQAVELHERAQSRENESCLPGSAVSLLSFLLFLPPTPLTGRADCENYYCTSWSRFKFRMGSKILGKRMWTILLLCCSVRIIIHSS